MRVEPSPIPRGCRSYRGGRGRGMTGFDAPSMHTMYVDKPMRGHGLMQAIARVNRVFRDKPGGLVVDYIGIAQNLKSALAQYSASDQRQTGIDEAEARSEEHTSELQSRGQLVCRLLLDKKNTSTDS